MQAQNKTIVVGRQFVSNIEDMIPIVSYTFDEAASFNIHGLRVTIGASPAGPDETMVGRWYLVLLPNSVAEDSTTFNAWTTQLDTIAKANVALEHAEFIWGSGSFVIGEQSTLQETFAPRTTRNAKKGYQLTLFIVADAISGVIDDWDSAGSMTFFT